MTSVLANALDPEGPSAREIDDLWWLMLAVGAPTVVLTPLC